MNIDDRVKVKRGDAWFYGTILSFNTFQDPEIDFDNPYEGRKFVPKLLVYPDNDDR